MTIRRLALTLTCATTAALWLSLGAAAQEPRAPRRITPRNLTELRADDARISRMVREGDLRLREFRRDPLVPGRRIERADQYHRGVRVFGADVTRQYAAGQVVSSFGVLYDDIGTDVNPRLAEAEARRRVEERTGVTLGPARAGELVLLPREHGAVALAWRFRAFDGVDLRHLFLDARTGAILLDYSDLQTQSAVGAATGVLGDSKKMSAMRFSGAFFADDLLRPPSLRTYDMKGSPQRTVSIINGAVFPSQSDLGTDADNTWTDGALSDAHIYTGYTYDYYFARFRRRGLDDGDMRITTLVHPVRREDFPLFGLLYRNFYANAAYYGDGIVVYGVGLPPGVTSNGRSWDHTPAALDIVAHELTHGVIDYTSNLIYQNESGALNESFADIMGTAAEWMFHPPGSGLHRADYLCGEDAVRPNGIRSLADPGAYGHPDHYSIRYTGTDDGGGVHINSGIPNHVFYLAIEGGTNRTSGLNVQGVGPANRVQIESIFYRAVTQLLPANATFSMARAATIQAAQDLYGAGSNAERAITEAWAAVGVE